jgi:hypothetical protein
LQLYLLFCQLPFHLICKGVLSFYLVPHVWFCLCGLCFWRHIQEIITKSNVLCFPYSTTWVTPPAFVYPLYVFFWDFYRFRFLVLF